MIPNLLVLLRDIGSALLELRDKCGRNPMDKLIKIRVESIDFVNLLLEIFWRKISEGQEHLLIARLSPVRDRD